MKIPHNIEAEQALLGAVLLNNDIFDRVASLVGPDHFYDPVHARIFELMSQRIAKGALASAVTLKPFLADDPGLAELGGTDYIARLAGAAVTVFGAPDYARMISDLASRRTALQALEEAQERIMSMEDMSDVTASLEDALSETEDRSQVVFSFGAALSKAAERMNTAFQSDTPPGVSLGIPELTEAIGHVLPGDMILLGGRPSMGKSAVALDIATRAATSGVGVVFWCGEMLAEDNAERAMSAYAKAMGTEVSYHMARQGRMTEDQFRALLEAARDMQNLPIKIIDPAVKKIDALSHHIRRAVRDFQRQGRETLFVVDYLQQIQVGGKSKNRYEDISYVSGAIKSLAIELRSPVLALAQLSRQPDNRDNKRPMLADLRESGQLEQDANTVLFCYRDEYYLERLIPSLVGEEKSIAIDRLHAVRDVMEIIVAKQRSGPVGTFEIGFKGATNSIYSLPQRGGYDTGEMAI